MFCGPIRHVNLVRYPLLSRSIHGKSRIDQSRSCRPLNPTSACVSTEVKNDNSWMKWKGKDSWKNWIKWDSEFVALSDELNRKRHYFWSVDHQGRLFRKELGESKLFGEMKDVKILDYFFSHMQVNDTGLYTDDYPFLSRRMHELYFTQCAAAPIVFRDIRDGHLHYGATLKIPFDVRNIKCTHDGMLYYPVRTKAEQGNVIWGAIQADVAQLLLQDCELKEEGIALPPYHGETGVVIPFVALSSLGVENKMADMSVSEKDAPKKKQDKKEKKKKEAVPEKPWPAFIQQRLDVWDKVKAKREAEVGEVEKKDIKVFLPDGNFKVVQSHTTTPFDIAKGINKKLSESVVAAKVDNVLWDLHRPLVQDCHLQLLDFDHPDGEHVFWHSSAHILGEALELEYDCLLGNGPPVEDGFYYNMGGVEKGISTEDFDVIKKRVDKILAEKQPFERLEITKEELLEMFAYNKYKLEIINNKIPDGTRTTIYRSGPLIDLCRGPHLPHTGKVKAFKVTKNSSAYWLGDQKNDSMQRVYAVSFPDKQRMKDYEFRIKEAEKRDHRKIGKDQELFIFHELSPGSAFWLPHGTRIYNRLVDFIKGQYKKRGYDEVISPNVFNLKLWETSGHAQNYKENMFLFEVENQQFGMKPMNCPGHCLLFGSRVRSYKELPLRMADFGVLHRNELSGALSGLTRVRRFCQDDAHIFCTSAQIKQEVGGVLDMLKEVYGIFGFEFKLNLSTRPEKFLGDIAVWDKAEKDLEDALTTFAGKDWEYNPGDGAFYGPKIDIQVFDALKRKHQCATIQLDFQLPIRFDLNYVSDKTEDDRPVIIHRAILGSVERMVAILIEHTAGKWPLWLSPRQVMIVPVALTFKDYCEDIKSKLHDAGFYVDADLSDHSLNKKIRQAQLAQYNFILVVGNEEVSSGSVNIRTRDNQVHGTKPIGEFIAELQQLVAEFK